MMRKKEGTPIDNISHGILLYPHHNPKIHLSNFCEEKERGARLERRRRRFCKNILFKLQLEVEMFFFPKFF